MGLWGAGSGSPVCLEQLRRTQFLPPPSTAGSQDSAPLSLGILKLGPFLPRFPSYTPTSQHRFFGCSACLGWKKPGDSGGNSLTGQVAHVCWPGPPTLPGVGVPGWGLWPGDTHPFPALLHHHHPNTHTAFLNLLDFLWAHAGGDGI